MVSRRGVLVSDKSNEWIFSRAELFQPQALSQQPPMLAIKPFSARVGGIAISISFALDPPLFLALTCFLLT